MRLLCAAGDNLGSIYTYNGIACMGCGSWGVVTGTEGGRLEFWSLVTRKRTAYVDAFQSQVTAVWVSIPIKNRIVCFCDGHLKLSLIVVIIRFFSSMDIELNVYK